MIELTLLTVLNRLMSWGRAPVIATRLIAADAAVLLTLVSDPAAERVILGDVFDRRLRLHTHVKQSRSQRLVTVRVALGRRDVLWITWILTPRPGTTEVDLAAQPESRALLARMMVALGGSRWLRRRLDKALDRVAALAHRAAEDVDPSCRQVPPRRRPPTRRVPHATTPRHEPDSCSRGG